MNQSVVVHFIKHKNIDYSRENLSSVFIMLNLAVEVDFNMDSGHTES